MTDLSAAIERVNRIEAAVAAGDLEGANAAAADLKPLLVSDRIDELLALRARIENLTIGVTALRDQDLDSLKKLKHQRDGASAYRQMQNRSLST